MLLFLQEGIEETDVRRIEKRMEKTISDLMATIHRIQVSSKLHNLTTTATTDISLSRLRT